MKLTVVVAAFSVLYIVSSTPILDSEWLSYKVQYNKQYNETEDRTRYL
jgi:hypothetical protein